MTLVDAQKEHLDSIRNDLVEASVSLQMYAKLVDRVDGHNARPLILEVLQASLKAQIILTLNRAWDKKDRKDGCYRSFNELQKTFELGDDDPLWHQVCSLGNSKNSKALRDIRDTHIAHSLQSPKPKHDSEIPLSEIQSYVQECYILLGKFYDQYFSLTLNKPDVRTQLKEWEAALDHISI